jgi:hypothetical protein
VQVDRFVQHQAALAAAEHRPAPIVAPVFDAEAKLSIERDARGHAAYRQHRDEAIQLH